MMMMMMMMYVFLQNLKNTHDRPIKLYIFEKYITWGIHKKNIRPHLSIDGKNILELESVK